MTTSSEEYTVVIPTMWVSPFILKKMAWKYNDSPYVKEILIINNNDSHKVNLDLPKVRVIGTGANLYVNPSWNLGVKEAKTQRVIIANDDIFINPFNSLMELIDRNLAPGVIIGMSTSCYRQKGLSPGHMRIDVKTGMRNWGFGTFMAIYKDSYVQIPDKYKIFCGDDILYKANKAMVVRGVEVITKMSETVSNPIFKQIKRDDVALYNKEYGSEGVISPNLKILVVWDGVKDRDLAQYDMYEALSDYCRVFYATKDDVHRKIVKIRPNIIWLDIYHQTFNPNWRKLLNYRLPFIIDQADNEEFVERAISYNQVRRKVVTSRYLPNKSLQLYSKKTRTSVVPLGWYVNPDRFWCGDKNIDVAFISFPKGIRGELMASLKDICAKNNWTFFGDSAYGKDYSDILSRTKVFVVESDRKCLTQKYIEGSLSGCTLAGDIPIYPSNNVRMYSFDLGLEEMIRQALQTPVVNKIESSFLKDFSNIVKILIPRR
jgi:hypothetical protein